MPIEKMPITSSRGTCTPSFPISPVKNIDTKYLFLHYINSWCSNTKYLSDYSQETAFFSIFIHENTESNNTRPQSKTQHFQDGGPDALTWLAVSEISGTHRWWIFILIEQYWWFFSTNHKFCTIILHRSIFLRYNDEYASEIVEFAKYWWIFVQYHDYLLKNTIIDDFQEILIKNREIMTIFLSWVVGESNDKVLGTYNTRNLKPYIARM